MKSRRQIILDIFSDAMTDILYYDRKESDPPVGGIEEAIKTGEVTVDEIVQIVRDNLPK